MGGAAQMRGDPTNRCEVLTDWLVMFLILGLVAIPLHDVM
jgi:hypothetical protein